MLVQTVNDNANIENLRQLVCEAAAQTRAALNDLPADPMEALYKLRFNQYGRHPLENRPLNLIEQFNSDLHNNGVVGCGPSFAGLVS
jgi:hypothetical protein